LLVAAALVMVGCVNDHNMELDGNDAREVRLWADVGY
jgi:hypothetical protein